MAEARVWRTAGNSDYVEGTHGAYSPYRHTRGVLAVHGIGWWILDHILGPSTPVSFEAFWHLHPGWQLTSASPHVALLTQEQHALTLASTAPLLLLPPGESPLAVWSPDYGVVEPAPTAQSSIEVTPPATIATFIPATSAMTSGVTIEPVPVGAACRRMAHRILPASLGRRRDVACSPPSNRMGRRPITMLRPSPAGARPSFRQTQGWLSLVEDGQGWSEAVLVNGAELHVGGDPLVSLPHRRPLVRMTQLAPAVHEV